MTENKIVVLAYSGGLDTSALIPWLQENYGYQVVACLVDIGRVKDVPGIMARAEAAGAVAAVAIDAKEEFAEHAACRPSWPTPSTKTSTRCRRPSAVR